jgi:hypothetical protein
MCRRVRLGTVVRKTLRVVAFRAILTVVCWRLVLFHGAALV